MIDVHTEIEPPGLDADEDDGEPCIGIHAGLFEPDGTRRAGYGGVPVDADPDTIAAAMIDTLLGAAATRGPDLHAAVLRRVRRL